MCTFWASDWAVLGSDRAGFVDARSVKAVIRAVWRSLTSEESERSQRVR